MIPPLEETFAGNVWRVQAVEGGYAVLASGPMSFGAEVEICRVQYLPHAMAIAALPEFAAMMATYDAETLLEKLKAALHKAEGRHITGKETT